MKYYCTVGGNTERLLTCILYIYILSGNNEEILSDASDVEGKEIEENRLFQTLMRSDSFPLMILMEKENSLHFLVC